MTFRRPFQFSLGFIFFVVTAVAVWLATRPSTVATLRAKGAVFVGQGAGKYYKNGDAVIHTEENRIGTDGEIEAVICNSGSAIENSDLAVLRKLRNVKAVFLNKLSLNDKSIDHLIGVPSLQYVSISGSGVTDSGFLRLSSLPSLEVINVSGTTISESAISQFRTRCPKVHVVRNHG